MGSRIESVAISSRTGLGCRRGGDGQTRWAGGTTGRGSVEEEVRRPRAHQHQRELVDALARHGETLPDMAHHLDQLAGGLTWVDSGDLVDLRLAVLGSMPISSDRPRVWKTGDR